MRVITVSLNTIWQPSESSLLSKLRAGVPATVLITSIERTLFSNRYSITVESDMEDGLLNEVIFAILKNLNYEPDLLLIESGVKSSAPGGIVGAVESTVKTAQTPLIAIAVVVVIIGAVYFLPRNILKGE